MANVAKIVALDIARRYEKFGVNNKTECKKGCSACCYQIVTISIYDAIRIAESLLFISNDDVEVISQQAKKNVSINNKIKVDSERWAHQLPCPFLLDNVCFIHSDRPIVCLATNSISSDLCNNQLRNRNKRGHEVIGANPSNVTGSFINNELVRVAAELNNLFPQAIYNFAFQIDLDKLVEYIAHPSEQVRKDRLIKLKNFDKKVIKKLKKRSLNQTEYDSIYGM